MKKRRVKLLALALAVSVSSTSLLSVGAAGTDGMVSEALGVTETAGFEEETLTEPTETGTLEPEASETEEDFTTEALPEETVESSKPQDGELMGAVSQVVNLEIDAYWASDEEEAVPSDTIDKKLYKIENGEETDEYYTADDGLIEVITMSGESYYYLFDDSGLICTGHWLVNGANHFFTTKELVKGEDDSETPVVGRMKTNFWIYVESNDADRHYEWVYYGDDGAETVGYTEVKDVYLLSEDVQWEQETDAKGNPFWRLYVTDGSQGRYFVEEDGLITVKETANAVESRTYYFDNDGAVAEGAWVVDGEDRYFTTQEEAGKNADPTNSHMGAMVADDWVLTNQGTEWQYYNILGVQEAKSGYVEIDGDHYYLKEDGSILTGIISVNGTEKYFSPYTTPIGKESEPEEEGWVCEDGAWRYQLADGTFEIRQGFQQLPVGGELKWHFLDEDGVPMKKTMQKYAKNGRYYYFGSDGIRVDNKFATVNGKKYYFGSAGARVTYKNVWKTINRRKYYFNSKSEVDNEPGWHKIGKYWYYFSAAGNMQWDRWINQGGKKYYVNINGVMLGGLREIDGYLYYFKWSQGEERYGYALTNRWVKTKGKWYYANSSGRMQKGWIALGTKKYYLDENCVLVTDQWLTHPTDGRGYVDSDGLFHKGNSWVNVKGHWRYLKDGSPNGYATGWTWIGGYKYLFKDNGDMVTDLSNMAGFTGGPYLYDVNRSTCTVTVLGRDESGNYTVPVIAFACSVGLPGTPTPVGGPWTLQREGRWQLLMGPSWGQYGTHVLGAGQGGIYFHSVAGSAPNNHYALNPVEFNRLGSPASHGCIRLCVRDAKWIWDHWGAGGNRARVVDRPSGNIFYKPSLPKVGPTVHYDPTDPAL